jgi:cupin fold WbuC family metalloprotein
MVTTALRLLDADTIARTAAAARGGPRGRSNHNLHPTLDDPVQRFLNIVQPGSYVRPHRHQAGRWELFLLLEGEAAAVLFDEAGTIVEAAHLRRGGDRGVEIPGGAWHTVFALAPDTLLFEVKPGPYAPIDDKDFAPWAPAEGTPEAATLLRRWHVDVDGRPESARHGRHDTPASSSS